MKPITKVTQELIAVAIVDTITKERKNFGLNELEWNTLLVEVAKGERPNEEITFLAADNHDNYTDIGIVNPDGSTTIPSGFNKLVDLKFELVVIKNSKP